ncbi:NAD dependent epimerase/dehydratase family protein [Nocardia nova SH22a]|uniref:NAD dependent epimerase/dehydratase family protein n=1 Tax=Nocardia nova SH22a TaxID=1415166 RepID=W5TJR9_9NOCA|nr:NAD-dependent epimerase/dehydratase family protein [Nocardia nova]AHH19605.1 NAD dependent epimerase/dehydratase family protein [Nocardia nova SH22a]
MVGTEADRGDGSKAGPILVTGAFGLVGTAVVRALNAAGVPVVATDLDVPANRRAARRLTRAGGTVRWTDLTAPEQVETLLDAVRPSAIVHLAAIIPPVCYQRRRLARAVNVDATATLVRCAEKLSAPSRFVLASSIAVYGARNPHRDEGLLSADTPMRPSDLYGAHKAAAEGVVRSSSLEWVILRLGGVLSVEPMPGLNSDTLYFEAAIPADGRISTVDVRDVATAMVAATTTESTKEIFLIGGDRSHRLRQRDIGSSVAAATGLTDAIPPGRPGDPARDEAWFATDWMDTERSQEVLRFQEHSFPDMLAEILSRTGLLRYLAAPAAPAVRWYLRRSSPYRDEPGAFADPWKVIRARLGDPDPDLL